MLLIHMDIPHVPVAELDNKPESVGPASLSCSLPFVSVKT